MNAQAFLHTEIKFILDVHQQIIQVILTILNKLRKNQLKINFKNYGAQHRSIITEHGENV